MGNCSHQAIGGQRSAILEGLKAESQRLKAIPVQQPGFVDAYTMFRTLKDGV